MLKRSWCARWKSGLHIVKVYSYILTKYKNNSCFYLYHAETVKWKAWIWSFFVVTTNSNAWWDLVAFPLAPKLMIISSSCNKLGSTSKMERTRCHYKKFNLFLELKTPVLDITIGSGEKGSNLGNVSMMAKGSICSLVCVSFKDLHQKSQKDFIADFQVMIR